MERKNITIVGGGSTYILSILMSLIEEKALFHLHRFGFMTLTVSASFLCNSKERK